MFGFIIALLAGVLTPHIEPSVARPLARALSRHMPVEEGETRLLAFLVALVGAGVLCALFDTGSPLGVAFGAGLGYFGLRLLAAMQKALDPGGR
ncbi:hypothetical protein [Salibaculum sp.]|uniref:hypothetical protein n=1 Tax=Salibaculum sp. TaxID=2855480 RepID=UPI002B459A55|nr:hypothetical protein [Salibaculum sp.]HKL68899.1 hypothetical protein [Salibaculum sp.]